MGFRQHAAAVVLITILNYRLAFAEDLSPKTWTAEERKHADQLEQIPFPLQARTIEGRSGLVSATMSPIAVLAGIKVLQHGGTAADAAATVALTQVATALGSYVSYAGVLQLLYYDAKSGRVYSMSAGWNSYRHETDPKTIPVDDMGVVSFGLQPTEGAQGRKTLVPGFLATAEQLAILRKLDCEYAQGYYFSKPLTANEAGALLEEHPKW